MLNRKCALIAVMLLPSLLVAQRGGKDRGTREPDWDKTIPASAPQLSSKDVESLNSIKLFIGRRKELKLSDEQVRQFKDLDLKQNEANHELLKAVDSLRKAARPLSTSPDDVEKVRLQLAREAMINAVATIRENYAAGVNTALPQLDEAQKSTAQELLQKQAKESDEMLSEKFGAGRSRGANGGGSPATHRGPITSRGRGGNS